MIGCSSLSSCLHLVLFDQIQVCVSNCFCFCSRLLENTTDTFSYYLDGLSPYTQYLFRVVVSHKHGQTVGPWATLHTAEDSKYTYTCAQVKMNKLVIHRRMHLHPVLLHTM